MKMTHAALAAVLCFATSLASAQAPVPPLSNAALRAKITALEAELASVQRDYRLMLANCQERAQPAPVVAPANTAAAEGRARARAVAAEEAAIAELARREAVRQQLDLDNSSWFVSNLDFGITETNRVFSRFAWNATVRNSIPRPQRFDLTVEFLNAKGLIVDTARLYGQVIGALDERIMRGSTLISMPAALEVTNGRVVAARKSESP